MPFPQEDKKQLIYYVPGATSGVKPRRSGSRSFCSPTDQIDPHSLELYRFEPTNGRREILIRKKKKNVARPILHRRVSAWRRASVRIRVDGSLSPGEYCLTPNGVGQSLLLFGDLSRIAVTEAASGISIQARLPPKYR